jgi:hypothetical protein
MMEKHIIFKNKEKSIQIININLLKIDNGTDKEK